MKLTKVRRRLGDSLNNGRIVTAVRDAFEDGMTDGLVIALTNDWVVIHDVDNGVYLDAIVMLRLEDISRVWFRDDDAYHHRAMAGLGTTVAVFDCDDEASTADLLDVASAQGGIFEIRMENLAGEPLSIGRLTHRRSKSFDLLYVGRDGVWVEKVERWKYSEVTYIQMGGRYLEALNCFADPCPFVEDHEAGRTSSS